MTVGLLLAQVAATLFMTGVIWIIQCVHYPLFARVGEDGFGAYARRHQRVIAPVVVPVMAVELGTAVLLLFSAPAGIEQSLLVAGAILLLPIWLSTALVQVPVHRRLATGFDDRAVTRLVRTNWVRTSLWSARSVLVLVVLRQAIER